ncbi:MAG: N(4)-(beta-N-acetylglucosaminyl)-L-asparaginase [Solobacterium sp.]|nr:N(4)-(beta-N-acetylglucosaminyl)-L-asparaginase [Solobacterium sp.]
MSWAILSTWKLSLEGNESAAAMLGAGCSAADAVIKAVQMAEDEPLVTSVGRGGLPDREGHVTLDAAFMDGDTLQYGAVGALEGIASPVAVAYGLSKEPLNNVLVGEGAYRYALAHGYETRDNRTESSMNKWKESNAEDSHDTVCVLAQDEMNRLCAAVSTSGLFKKTPGRIGDSPIIGSGFYADSEVGAAACTGVGEEIMRGVLSFQACMNLKQGMDAQTAAECALNVYLYRLTKVRSDIQPISLIVLDRKGNYGVATNTPFPFVYTSSASQTQLYLADPITNGHCAMRLITDPSLITLD